MIMNIFVILLIFIIGLFVQFSLHEISHIIFGHIFEGRKPKKIWPYPHRFNGKFYFARYEMYEATKVGNEHMVPISPLISGLVYYIITMLILFIIREKNIYLFSFAAFNAADCLFFWYTVFFGSKESDGKKFLYYFRKVK